MRPRDRPAEPPSRDLLLARVAQLPLELLDAPLELVDALREPRHILEAREAELLAGGVGEAAHLLLERLDHPARPRLEVPNRPLPARLQLVPELANVARGLGARLAREGLRLAAQLPEEVLALPANALDGVTHLRQRPSRVRACHVQASSSCGLASGRQS